MHISLRRQAPGDLFTSMSRDAGHGYGEPGLARLPVADTRSAAAMLPPDGE